MNLVKMNLILNGTIAKTLVSNTYPTLIPIQLYIGGTKGGNTKCKFNPQSQLVPPENSPEIHM